MRTFRVMADKRDEYITTKQAAAIMGISPEWVANLAANGRIEAKKFGHMWQISHAAAVKYREENAGKSKHDPRRGN